MNIWGWIGIAAAIGTAWGYRRKLARGLPGVVDLVRCQLDPEDLLSIYAAVKDPEARHGTAVELLVEAARRKGLNMYITPGTAELFIDNIDEIIRRIHQ